MSADCGSPVDALGRSTMHSGGEKRPKGREEFFMFRFFLSYHKI